MRRDYTDKTTKFAEEKREWEERVEITESFQEKVKTPEGMARYLSATMERHPIIVGAAFEAIATGDKAKDFLIAVGEAKPEVFEEAYDQLQELLADDDARKQYHRTREFQSKESELEEREDRLRRGTFQRQYGSLWSAVEKEASRMKLDAEDLKEVEARLHERLEGHVRQDGSITLRPQDAKEVVKETKELLDRQYERALKKLGKTRVKESREAVKKKARTAQSNVGRAAPRSAPRKAPREHTRFKHDGKGDPLDSFIDHRLG